MEESITSTLISRCLSNNKRAMTFSKLESSRQNLIPKNHLQKWRIAVWVKLFSICKIPKVGDGGASLPAGGSYGGVRMEAIVDLPTSPSPRSPVCRYSSCWWGQRCHRRRSQKPLSLRFHQPSIQENQSSKVFFLPLLCRVIPFFVSLSLSTKAFYIHESKIINFPLMVSDQVLTSDVQTLIATWLFLSSHQ